MDPEGKKARIFESVDALFKSWWTVVAGISLGVVAALVILAHVDKRYEAATLIRVAPQSIPEDFVRSTVTDDMSERLLEIEQAILSRTYMDRLIDSTFGTPKDEEEREGLMRELRSQVQVLAGDTRLCSLVYRDSDAERAAHVVNELTRLYVEQNKEFRASQAQSTRETFERRAATALSELDEIEQQLSEFNTRHRHETEAFLDANLQLLETRRDDLDANQRDQSATRLRLDALKGRVEMNALDITASDGTTVPNRRALRIREIRIALEDLRTRYADTHPDVVKKQRELDDVLAGATSEPQTTNEPAAVIDPELTALQSQERSIQLELDHLQQTEAELRSEIALIESRINRTPTIQAELSDLQEQQRILGDRYRDLKDKAERARSSVLLEETEQGQRLEVIEWATVPFQPIFPDPFRIYTLGILASLALFIGPVVLRSVLNPVVSSEAGLRSLTEIPVLVSIPRLVTRDTSGVVRKRFLKNLGFSVVSSAVLVAVFVYLNGL